MVGTGPLYVDELACNVYAVRQLQEHDNRHLAEDPNAI